MCTHQTLCTGAQTHTHNKKNFNKLPNLCKNKWEKFGKMITFHFIGENSICCWPNQPNQTEFRKFSCQNILFEVAWWALVARLARTTSKGAKPRQVGGGWCKVLPSLSRRVQRFVSFGVVEKIPDTRSVTYCQVFEITVQQFTSFQENFCQIYYFSER